MATTVNKSEHDRLITLLKSMCETLEDNRLDSTITTQISDFWYMQRVAELEILEDQFQQMLTRASEIQNLREKLYRQTGKKYQKDIRWLKKYKKLINKK